MMTMAAGFAERFGAAFDRLDDGYNQVALSALRAEFPRMSREAFDLGLKVLRREGRYVVQPFEGRHGAPPEAVVAGGIVERGTHYVYAARRM